jgi:hypothetical protein
VALRYDLLVNQGEDYKRTIPIIDDATGQPASVSGWTIVGQIRDGYNSDTVLHTLDVTADDTNLVLNIPGADSAAWTFRLARYDVKVTAPNTTTTRELEGAVVVYAQVSHA